MRTQYPEKEMYASPHAYSKNHSLALFVWKKWCTINIILTEKMTIYCMPWTWTWTLNMNVAALNRFCIRTDTDCQSADTAGEHIFFFLLLEMNQQSSNWALSWFNSVLSFFSSANARKSNCECNFLALIGHWHFSPSVNWMWYTWSQHSFAAFVRSIQFVRSSYRTLTS